MHELDVVTGAFSYTGKYITKHLLSLGREVKTLTGHPNRPSPLGDKVKAFRFNFEKPSELIKNLEGATTLYNTYWIRFQYKQVTFEKAIENTKVLIRAAEEAGIKKIVHISITNASEESHLPYFRGKGIVEKIIMSSKLSYVIVRPTVIFGIESILINNIAWFLRKFPVFPIFGSGDYKVQPVSVEDVAEIAVNASKEEGNLIIDAAGPEIYTFSEMIELIADSIKSKVKIFKLNPSLVLLLTRLIGYIVRDVVITKDEIEGLMSNLLVSGNPPTGKVSLSNWLNQNSNIVGVKYISELAKHYR